MKVTCCIDHLGPGGAQRQLCLLARSMRDLRHDVTVVTYNSNDHFREDLLQNGIEHIQIAPCSYWNRFWTLRRILREGSHDIVIAFLRTPSLLAELATLPSHPFKLIVSERNFYPDEFYCWRKFRLLCHELADSVVTNGLAVKEELEGEWPRLSSKLVHIPNGVDCELFSPLPRDDEGKTRIIVLAKYEWQKGPHVLMEALSSLEADHPELDFQVDWYGANDRSSLFLETRALALRLGLGDRIRLHGPTREPHLHLQKAHLFVLPSLYEGMANVVGEALASGCPVIINSSVNSNGLVVDSKNGFLFDGGPEDLKCALTRFFASSPTEKRALAHEARQSALRELSLERFVEAYCNLIHSL